MPLKCRDPDTGVHTCTIAHSHRHTRAHRHAHMCRLLRTDTVTEAWACTHTVQICRSARPPGPWRWAQISFRGALCPVWGRFPGKLTEMPITWVTRLLEEGGTAPRWDRRALHPGKLRRTPPASMCGSPSGLSRVLQALSQMMTLPTMKEDALLSVEESQKLLGAQDGLGL